MSKSLIVAEKPSVAADIAKALGGFTKVNGYYERDDALIAPARGHLVELAYPDADRKEAWLITALPIIPAAFTLEVSKDCADEFNRIKKLMARDDVADIINACDAGREGELIFRLIYRKAGAHKPIKRMWIQSMVASSIRTAYDAIRPGADFDQLYDAALCRAEADWIVGINGTRAASALRQKQTQQREVTNVGRVQTPTLAMPVLREREIDTFVVQDYWEVHGTFRAPAGTYLGKWCDAQESDQVSTRFFDKEKAQAIVQKCTGVAPSQVTDNTTPENRLAPKLFDLTALQREANKRYKFSAKKTLDLAQALYETHKATTYPRTDSSSLPEDYLNTAETTLLSFSGTPFEPHAQRVLQSGWVAPNQRIFNNEDISDHFAIVPTGQQPAALSPDEQTIYDLISRRFIAAFFPAALYQVTIRTTVVADEIFRTKGKVLQEPGWLSVYGANWQEETDPALCKLDPAEPISSDKIDLKGMQTKPPKRYTEATLLSAMEHAGRQVEDESIRAAMKGMGLGRPATRASIIEGLLASRDRKGNEKEPYLVRRETELVPTPKAMSLIAFLEECGIEMLVSPRMTGDWEHKLVQMEQGQYRRNAFMTEIGTISSNIVDIIRTRAQALPDTPSRCLAALCRKCNGPIRVNGRAYECTNCDFKLWTEVAGRRMAEPEIESLLRDGKTPVLSGFTSRADKKFSAALRLDAETGKTEFVFEDKPTTAGGPAKCLAACCPRCAASIEIRGKTYACTGCDFKIWSEILTRKLSTAEAELLIEKGRTSQLSGFKSSAGRKFSAALKLDRDTWKIGFEFADRKPSHSASGD